MDPFSRPVLIWRWSVFLLAAFYSVYMIGTGNYASPGGPFRYLTIWALLLSFYSASRMLAYSERRIDTYHDAVPAIAAVVNAMVVYLYWRLFLTDPALVRAADTPPIWWQEYYLHLVGPLLQWIDALFVRRGFRRFLPAFGGLLLLILAYVAWAELFVGPMNARPVGTVTSGLPYPFLNNLEWPQRAVFYAANGAAAAVLLGIFSALAFLVRRGTGTTDAGVSR